MSPAPKGVDPGIVKVRTKLKSRMGRLMLANSITLTPGTLTVKIGAGAAIGGSGNPSYINTYLAMNGGCGGPDTANAGSGATGGGMFHLYAAGSALYGPQGFGGGTGATGNDAGGGGGAGGAGGNSASTLGGTGGAGITSSIDGSAVGRCGGGGGFGTTTPGTATDGGGAGGNGGVLGTAGATNRGGGGGGANSPARGGAGGSGVVYVVIG